MTLRILFLLLTSSFVVACGTKGPLVMPPGSGQPPLLGNPTPPASSVEHSSKPSEK